MDEDKRACACHGLAMYWKKNPRHSPGGYWACREKRKALDAKRWESYYNERIPFAVRARKDMSARRSNALARRRERHERTLA